MPQCHSSSILSVTRHGFDTMGSFPAATRYQLQNYRMALGTGPGRPEVGGKSLHWLKINERITYKLLSLTYKVLTTNQPQYLHNSISVQPCHNTRSSSMVTCSPTY